MSAYQWTYTHVHGNTLDLLLTNIEENIHSLLIHSQQRLLSSDHYGRTFRLASKLPTYYTFNYSKGDYIGLSNYLWGIDFTPCFQSHDVQEIYMLHYHYKCYETFRSKIHSYQHPPWFIPEIRHQLKCLRTLRRKYKLNKNSLAVKKVRGQSEATNISDQKL